MRQRGSLVICLLVILSCQTSHVGSVWTQHKEQRSIFLQNVADTFLMYEFLSGGLEIGKNSTVTLKDEELSSLRPAKAFLSIMEMKVQKTPSAIKRRLADLPGTGETLEMDTFEQLLLASVYVAHRAQRSIPQSQQVWGHVFCQLVAALTHDLSQQVVKC
ncbi:protein FAM180A [Narcine bancroftii]|uniref:protein FAM180A n=1 Tax=Narcine bancroftii TaxID=1343680 RepID=UPI0038314D9D